MMTALLQESRCQRGNVRRCRLVSDRRRGTSTLGRHLVVVDAKDLAITGRGALLAYIENKTVSPFVAEAVIIGAVGPTRRPGLHPLPGRGQMGREAPITFYHLHDLAARPEVYTLLRRESKA